MSVGNCGGKWLVLFYGDQTLRPEEILVYRMEFTDNVTRFFLPRGIRGTTKECNSLSRSNRLHSQRDKAEVSTEKGLTNPLSAGWSCCKRRVRHDKLAAREQWRHQSQKKKKKKKFRVLAYPSRNILHSLVHSHALKHNLFFVI